jgi:hypothetical protein
MPTETRTLGQYVSELIARLGWDDPAALVRMRTVVGDFRGKIGLDDEAIGIHFGAAGLELFAPAEGNTDGSGVTDRETVLDLLDGRIEVTEALLDGRIEVVGPDEAVTRMLAAIEILLAGSAHIPSLQQLASDFRADPRRAGARVATGVVTRRTLITPGALTDSERALLQRLDLLT